MTKLSDLKPGMLLDLDPGFTCHAPGMARVYADERERLFFHCADGKHYLDGQENAEGVLVGVQPW